MIGLVMVLASAAEPVTSEASVIAPNTLAVTRTIVTTSSVQVPPVIASAVIPYFRCIAARGGVPLNRAGQPLATESARARNCAAIRKTATDEADTLLKAAGVTSEEARWSQVAATLASVESLITPPDGAK